MIWQATSQYIPTNTHYLAMSFPSKALLNFASRGQIPCGLNFANGEQAGKHSSHLGLGRRLNAKVHALSENGSDDGMEKGHEFLKFQVYDY